MSTGAKLFYGSKLKMGNGSSPEAFTDIAEVIGLGEFGSEFGLQDATNLDSENGFMEYIASMKDGMEITITANFLPANATQGVNTGLIAAHNAGTTKNFKLALPSPFGTFNFSGLVRSWRAGLTTAEKMTATFGVKLTGPITWQA